MSEFGYYRQLSAAELQEKARRSASQASKKGQKYEPLPVITSRKLCSSWWGEAWCENLERYSDYSNRLPRGKRYAKNGTIVDLKIRKGLVEAKVQGSRAKPYTVKIHIDPLDEKHKEAILKKCSMRIASLEDLVEGHFPPALQELFTDKNGLFPSPDEIDFGCSCPDWAYMCKHVAAVMYGIGVRLDENPFLFFELRGIDPESLVQKTIENKLEAMLQNADAPSPRILDDDPTSLFGL